MRQAALVLIIPWCAARPEEAASKAGCCKGMPLRVGFYHESIPPFQKIDEATGKLSGYMPAFGELLFQHMGFEVEWIDMGWETDWVSLAYDKLRSGEIDTTLTTPVASVEDGFTCVASPRNLCRSVVPGH